MVAEALEDLPLKRTRIYHLLMSLANAAGKIENDLVHSDMDDQTADQATFEDDQLDAELQQIRLNQTLDENEQQKEKDLFRALTPITADEIEEYAKMDTFIDGLSHGAEAWETVVRDMEIADPAVPWIPGTRPGRRLYEYQIAGTHWIVQMLGSRLGACLLGDLMGLGKTIQALCATVRIRYLYESARDRANPNGEANFDYSNSDDPDLAWGNLPTLIVCPKQALAGWQEEFGAIVADGFQLVVYDVNYKQKLTRQYVKENMNGRTIVLTTPDILIKRNGSNSMASWVNGLRGEDESEARDARDWPFNLSDCFGLGIIDEAHVVKDPTTVIWQTLKQLNLKFRMLLSGTPIINRNEDLDGIMGLMEYPEIWDVFGIDQTVDPFSLSGEGEDLLLCTQRAIQQIVKEEDKIRRRLLLSRVYKVAMLQRSYVSWYNGKPILKDMPAHKRVTLLLQMQSGPLRTRLQHVTEKHLADLFPPGKRTYKGKAVMDAKEMRQLAHTATFMGLDGLNWTAEKCKRFRKSGQDLRTLLTAIQGQVGVNSLGFDVNDYDETPEGKMSLLKAVALQSPKIRQICFLLAHLVVIVGTKAVIWVGYPWTQLLIELFLQYADIDSESLHADLDQPSRDKLVRRFNTTDNPSVMVCNYQIGATCLNLQAKCYFNIVVEPATSRQLQEQAIHRIRRVGQTHIQYTIFLAQLDTINPWQLSNQMNKGLDDLMAHTEEDEIVWVEDTRGSTESQGAAAQELWNRLCRGDFTSGVDLLMRK
ncbi:hypothetical protein ONS96_005289 [Cadophora gregata f. sp. sojae]|nr:hypothetical protein ONS96_005289 [Cadophora gregata f. sp. sojae]